MQGWSLSAIYIGGSHGDAVHADDGVAFICGCLYETLNRPRKSSIQNNSFLIILVIYYMMLLNN